MTIFGPDASLDTFTVDQGEIVFVPRGYIHHIESIGMEEAKFVLSFTHEKPEDLGLPVLWARCPIGSLIRRSTKVQISLVDSTKDPPRIS